MNAAFERTLAEPREPDPAEPASRGRRASCLARLRELLTGRVRRSRLLSDKSALFMVGDQYLREARSAGRPLSLAVFEFSDLKELRAIYGSSVKRAVVVQVVARMAVAAGAHGVVARTAAAEFALLMPGFDRARTIRAVRRAMGNPVRIEIESDDHEIVLMPEFQVGCVGPDIESTERLYRELCFDLKEAVRVKREREQYLTRERESHSRSGGAPLRPGDPEAHGPGADIPPTVPASLAADGDNLRN